MLELVLNVFLAGLWLFFMCCVVYVVVMIWTHGDGLPTASMHQLYARKLRTASR